MRNVKFKTQFTCEPFRGEKNNGEFMIDPTGYIPAKRQIENMLYAGSQLDQSRLEDYDFRPGDNLEYREEFDLRKPDADFTDAQRIMQHLSERAAEGQSQSGSDDADASGAGDPAPGTESGSDGKSVE